MRSPSARDDVRHPRAPSLPLSGASRGGRRSGACHRAGVAPFVIPEDERRAPDPDHVAVPQHVGTAYAVEVDEGPIQRTLIVKHAPPPLPAFDRRVVPRDAFVPPQGKTAVDASANGERRSGGVEANRTGTPLSIEHHEVGAFAGGVVGVGDVREVLLLPLLPPKVSRYTASRRHALA